MHSRSKLDPPQPGAWILSLFAVGEARDVIAGDLSEEYFQRASQSGFPIARRWYWRQIFKSLPHLVTSAFRGSPWTTAAAIIAGFAFRKLIARLPEAAIFFFIERFQIFQRHFGAYRFLASTGIDIGHLITFLLAGALVAFVARRREVAPAIVLGLIFAGMAVVASVSVVIRFNDYAYLWRLSWYFSDAIAVVVGAVVVRTLRSDLDTRRAKVQIL